MPPPTFIINGRKGGQLTLCECGRCGNLWKPRVANPVRCPACRSDLWDKPRVYQVQGQEAPTQKPKPRGLGFRKGFDARRVR